MQHTGTTMETTAPGIGLLMFTGFFRLLTIVDPTALSHIATAIAGFATGAYYTVMFVQKIVEKRRQKRKY